MIDLGPLSAGDVRALLLTYLADEATVEAVLPQALRESGGVPGRVHDVAVALARRRLAVRVGDAAARTGQIHRALDAARGDLREGITELREVVEHHDVGGTGTCPWKGLEAYDVADAPWFAGRERLVAELLVRLTPAHLVAVVGASGSGKSSLLRAGLLAALEQGALPGSEAWDRLVMRPGPHPMRELVRVALRGAEPGRDRVADLLRRMVFEEQAATRAVLVVDQLEEVWTTCADPGERAAFLDALADIVESDTQCAVVLGVRADYVGELADQPVLARAMADATVLVGAPSEAEVWRAVTHPAGRAGLTLDVGLTDALVADAGDEPGSLPLLSTALTELWDHRDGHRLTLAAYASAGGIRGAVARIAERAFAALDTHDQAAARVLLLRLAGPGEGEAVTRRRVPLVELDALPDPRVRAVVDPLAQARLLSLSAGHVEVAHEALFREWPRLRGWLEEDTAARAVQRRLAGAAADWDAGGREPSEVWRGTRLAAGSEFVAKHPDEVTAVEQAFLEAGQAQHDADRRVAEERAEAATRQNRRLRWLLGGLGLLLVTALVAGVLTVQARSRAETQARVATARELAAAAVANLGADAELSTLLALEAVQHTRSHDGTVLPEAEEALHRAVTASRIVMTVDGIGGALDWSPAGDVFVTEGPERSGVVDVRDARTGASVRSWLGHDRDNPDVNQVAFSHDGSILATTGDDGTARVWDPTTGEELAVSQGPPGPVWAPSFSPDGSLLAALWTDQGIVRLIETGSGRTVRESEVPGGPRSLSFSPDGTRLAIAREPPGEVLVVDASTADTVMTLSDSDWGLGGVEWSPDGRWLATCGVDGLARVWDADTGRLRFTLHGHTDAVVTVAWSPDSARLATASEDGSAKVWEIDAGGSRQLLDLSGAATRSGVTGVAFSPDGDRVMTGNQLVSAVAVWDVGLGGDAESANFPAPSAFTGVDFTPDGRRLVTASDVGSATAWDLRTGKAVVTTGSHADDPATGGPVGSIDVSPDGTLIATAGEGSVRVWDASTGAEAFSVGAGDDATWSADGAHLARTGPEDGLTTIVDRAGKTVAELREEPDFVVLSVAFGPDASLLATARTYAGGEVPGPGPDQVTIWDWRRGVAVATMPTLAEHMAFDPTGARLATADPIGAAAVWDVASGREATTFEAHRAGVWDVAFSPDGGAVATGGRDGTVRLWDPETGVSRLVLGGDQGPVWAVRFSPDGRQLASSHASGLVRVWALDLDDLVEIAEDKVTRGLSDAECQQYLHVDTCPTAAR